MECLICGSSKTTGKYKIENIPLFYCPDCTCEFLFPQPSDLVLEHIYSEKYYQSWGISSSVNDNEVAHMKKLTGKKFLDKITSYQTNGKILDVGCALGYFLEAAKDEGFSPYGIEFSAFSSSVAKKKFGEEFVFNGTLESNPFPDNNFDVITMFDLIEHTRDPLKSLIKAKELLTGQGIICITTPNVSSALHFLMGRRWLHYKQEHLFYFSKPCISMLAKKAGLRVYEINNCSKTFTLDYVFNQFDVYKHFLLTPVTRLLRFIIPSNVRKRPFSIGIGEMYIIMGQA